MKKQLLLLLTIYVLTISVKAQQYIKVLNLSTGQESYVPYVPGVTTASTIQSVNGKTGVVVVTKNDVGLNLVDNTSDISKPVSTAVQNALNNLQSQINNIPVGSGGTSGTANKFISTYDGDAIEMRPTNYNPSIGIMPFTMGVQYTDNPKDGNFGAKIGNRVFSMGWNINTGGGRKDNRYPGARFGMENWFPQNPHDTSDVMGEAHVFEWTFVDGFTARSNSTYVHWNSKIINNDMELNSVNRYSVTLDAAGGLAKHLWSSDKYSGGSPSYNLYARTATDQASVNLINQAGGVLTMSLTNYGAEIITNNGMPVVQGYTIFGQNGQVRTPVVINGTLNVQGGIFIPDSNGKLWKISVSTTGVITAQ